MRVGRFEAALLALALLAASGRAEAQKPTSQTTEYSPYEQETIRRTLDRTGEIVDPAPEGKTIESIETVRLEILENRDPGPEMLDKVPIISPLVREPVNINRKALNSLHSLSKDYIIRREMLIHEGDRYVQVLVDETARNMRARMPLQVSIVIIVPVRVSAPDKVKLLVITKDIWSLRLSFDLSVTPGGLENLLFVPQETNLFGLHHTASTRFQYQPETYTFGAGYKVPRFGMSWVGATASASVIVNRRTGNPEGSAGSLVVGQSLYSTQAKWAVGAEASYAVGVTRRYVNAHVATFDSRATPERDGIPAEYKSRALVAGVSVTRSFGWALKNNFTFSMNAASTSYSTFDVAGFNPAATADFVQRLVPRGETRVYPSIGWQTFTTNFLRTLDINTLALQEDYRLGHDVSVAVYPVTRALGSTRTVIGISAKAGYAIPMGDGLVGAGVSTVAENQDEVSFAGFGCQGATSSTTDASVTGSVGAVTPRLGFGRIVMNVSVMNRCRNYLRSRTLTGGDDRLRGYPSNYFFGKDSVFYNIEFRSTSVEVLKAAIGGVVFFDAGDAAQGFDVLRAKQSVGVGIRALLPQLNRLVFRADLAFPLRRGPFPETGIVTKVDPVGFFFAFDQAFGP